MFSAKVEIASNAAVLLLVSLGPQCAESLMLRPRPLVPVTAKPKALDEAILFNKSMGRTPEEHSSYLQAKHLPHNEAVQKAMSGSNIGYLAKPIMVELGDGVPSGVQITGMRRTDSPTPTVSSISTDSASPISTDVEETEPAAVIVDAATKVEVESREGKPMTEKEKEVRPLRIKRRVPKSRTGALAHIDTKEFAAALLEKAGVREQKLKDVIAEAEAKAASATPVLSTVSSEDNEGGEGDAQVTPIPRAEDANFVEAAEPATAVIEEDAAAARIQAAYRGKAARFSLHAQQQHQGEEERESLVLPQAAAHTYASYPYDYGYGEEGQFVAQGDSTSYHSRMRIREEARKRSDVATEALQGDMGVHDEIMPTAEVVPAQAAVPVRVQRQLLRGGAFKFHDVIPNDHKDWNLAMQARDQKERLKIHQSNKKNDAIIFVVCIVLLGILCAFLFDPASIGSGVRYWNN